MRGRRAKVGGRIALLLAVTGAAGMTGVAGCDDGDGPGISGALGDAAATDGPSTDGGLPDLPMVSNRLIVQGKIVSAGTVAAAVASALVKVSIDRDNNGTLAADETSETVSAADGTYMLDIAVAPGQTALVKMLKEGMAPVHRAVNAAGGAQVTMNAVTAAANSLTCADGKCTSADNTLALEGLPAGATVAGVAMNPVVDSDKFPGAFQDSTGAVLKSAVFASIEVKDASGNPLTNLPAPAVLRMQVPVDTHRIVTDTKPGSDRIEVPMYYYDELKGTWVADGEGYLEDAAGMPIPETALAQVRAGSFPGAVVARANITHASYWNVDWPLATHSCITGVVVDELGRPMPGATLFAGGVDYTASYRPQTTSEAGRFCMDVLRAETPTEDLYGNGTMGDKHLVSLHVQSGQRLFLVGSFGPGTTEATCGGMCTDVGQLKLVPAQEVETALEGHWAGDWGDMVLRKVGDEYWGVYAHDNGTVVLRASPDGVYRGWWSETPSRMAPSDAGEVEFRFSWTGTELVLDGQWRYAATGAFRADWDLKHVTTPIPAGLEERFADTESFKRHP